MMVGRFFFLLFIFGGVIDYSYLCNRKEIFDLLRMNDSRITITYTSTLIVNGLQITTWYTAEMLNAANGKLWMAYRLLPSTPLVQFLMRIGVLWIAYGLLPSTPGLTLIGCGLWMAHGLPPLTPGTTKPDKAVRLWMARKLLPLTHPWYAWTQRLWMARRLKTENLCSKMELVLFCCNDMQITWYTIMQKLHITISFEWFVDYMHQHLLSTR